MKKNTLAEDLKGLNQLSREGFMGVSDVAESLHQNILSLGGLLNKDTKTNGLTGLVYRGVRFIAQRSFQGVDWAITSLSPLFPDLPQGQQRQRWLSLLNGLLGDHLVASGNPLALSMAIVHNQHAASSHEAANYWSDPNKKPVLLLHGLCLSEQCWQEPGRHGESLQKSGEFAPLYVRYNSGLAIADNGRQLSVLLNDLSEYMSSGKSFDVLAHSMGGLVFRSALHAAQNLQHDWPSRVNNLIFLGTPHHGALLEKTGSIAHYLMGISPYSRPFAKIADKRSQGIQDLKSGRISDNPASESIPDHIHMYAIASKIRDDKKKPPHHWLGDGLVTVPSALGHHRKKHRHLGIHESRQEVVLNVTHMGLLSDIKVKEIIMRILDKE